MLSNMTRTIGSLYKTNTYVLLRDVDLDVKERQNESIENG